MSTPTPTTTTDDPRALTTEEARRLMAWRTRRDGTRVVHTFLGGFGADHKEGSVLDATAREEFRILTNHTAHALGHSIGYRRSDGLDVMYEVDRKAMAALMEERGLDR